VHSRHRDHVILKTLRGFAQIVNSIRITKAGI